MTSHSRFAVVALSALALLGAGQTQPKIGYDTTPMLPGGKWHVHDGTRPQPPVVKPGETTWTKPPSDATVLFDGTDLSKWRSLKGEAAGWKVENGELVVTAKAGDIATREEFGDVQLHVEWATPKAVVGNGQERGNSGIFLMERYEIQVLDSFDNPTYPDGQAAAVYGQFPPLVNVSRPPGEWQTYDIVFIAPRFKDKAVESPARVTVFHNGVLVQHNTVLIGTTRHKLVGTYEPHGPRGSLRLQDHGNPTRFRNIWVRALGG